jgi:hypothetical protein
MHGENSKKLCILCSIRFSENHALYEMMCKSMAQADRTQTTI